MEAKCYREFSINMSYRRLVLLTLVYIYIPVFLFVATWIRWYICLPMLVGLAYGIYLVFCNTPKNKFIIFDFRVFIAYSFILLALMLYMGWGGVFKEHYDWYKHNAILNDLIEYDYPVLYNNNSGGAMLTYYIGVYLVPGLLGKCVGFYLAHIFLYISIWGFGIILYLNLLRIVSPSQIKQEWVVAFFCLMFNYPMIFLALFSSLFTTDMGMVNITPFGAGIIIDGQDGRLCAPLIYEIRGMYAGYYAFIAFIPIAVITVLFYQYKDKICCYMAIWIPGLLYCVLALPYVLIVCGVNLLVSTFDKNVLCKEKVKIYINNFIGFVTSVPLIAYYSGHLTEDKETGTGFVIQEVWHYPLLSILFVILTILPYIIAVYYRNRKNLLFYMVLGLLIISMFFRIGIYNDLMMSGTIPLSVFLMIFSIEMVTDNKSRLLGKIVLCVLVFISFFSIFFYNKRTLNTQKNMVYENTDSEYVYNTQYMIKNGLLTYGSMSQFADKNGNYEADLRYNYFTYDYKDKIFYKYFARK